MNDPILAGYVLSPSARTIDFSAVPGFALGRLFGIEHKKTGRLLYLAATPELAAAVSSNGLVLTLNASVDLTGVLAADALSFRYDSAFGAASEATTAALLATARGSTVTADTSGTLAAGGAATPVAASLTRQFIEITNTGPNPLAYRWGAAASAAVGHILGSGQTVRYDARVPTAALNLFSTAGTTFFVTTG